MAREGQPRDLSDELFEGTYGARDFDRPAAELERFPDSGMAAETAYLLLHDLLLLDGATGLNLASFVTTWMDDHAKRIVTEALGKNHIDHEEYPAAHRIEEICVRLLADLWNAPDHLDPVGVGTIGSSEAIMLGLLAHKWNWRARQAAAGRPTDKPNVVYGAETHVVWDKFARYFDVEARRVPMNPDRFIIDIADVRERVDENTIAVGAVLGTTFIGQVDPIPSLNDMCADIKATQGWDIPIHVDAASGGFIAPFSEPEFEWDFRLEHVRSINASGHKYGLVYPGVGWLVLKDRAFLPDDLVFNVNYLGAGQPTYTLNFSRGSAMIQAQLYNFLRLGREGYARIVQNMLGNAEYLTERLAEMGRFRLLNDRLPEPVVTFTFAENPGFDEFALAERLRSDGWIVPAYTLPPNAQDTKLLRIVVKERLSRTLVDSLLEDIDTAWAELSANPPAPRPGTTHPRPC